ncbi:hypothetical protein PBI_THONKO_104 [Mycobacterium phage Thonko]|uniref:Uncharacterized protein n=1 Tax=Mycobacterium phage Thonko TaxID=2282910 RepID=A0A346FCE9_9CAUD|nr:hypothetical protein I5G57_gp104 [Mycobacterium phage Thonko]AXN53374.1 hypothetical protein PBI_THONKO_104 [Mycobacterium phage Thonko]
MKWKRHPQTGAYLAGPYTVKRSELSGKFWTVSGPGVEGPSHRDAKWDGQQAAQAAIDARLADGGGKTCEAFRGDVVVADGRRGQITAVLPGLTPTSGTYCILFAYGKRLCLFRREFEVIEP